MDAIYVGVVWMLILGGAVLGLVFTVTILLPLVAAYVGKLVKIGKESSK